MSEVFEFRGVDSLYVAEVTKDDSTGYTCEAPMYLAPVAEVGKTTDSSNEAHYYDNKAMIVVNSESADKISITMAPPILEKLAKIIGKSFDSTTGMLVDGERQNKYFALMYRTKGTDGEYRYVSRLKGTFGIPEESNATENDGTDTTNTSVEFTGIYTTFEFNKGKKVNGSWVKGAAKGVVVDTRYGLANVTNFFTAVQTPDTIGSTPTLGTLNVTMAAGSTTGKTIVDTVSPITGDGNKLLYKVGATAETVTYDAALTSGWTALQLDADITATEGQIITVAEVTNTASKARKVGSATVLLA